MRDAFERYPDYVGYSQKGVSISAGVSSEAHPFGSRFRFLEMYCFLHDLGVPMKKLGIGRLRIIWLALHAVTEPDLSNASFSKLMSIFRSRCISFDQFILLQSVIFSTVFKPTTSSEACAILSTERFFRRFERCDFLQRMQQRYSLELIDSVMESSIFPKMLVPLRPFKTFETDDCTKIQELLLRL